eukprot:Seg17406.1 transcript_id=Seg17406.1/GoldUCD/mRNA.D3Y31 product="Spore coat polysaccharide biosynthesis protein SpsK" protein_id=Seg17406.1/GoldUCD/D3Y31
MKRVLVFGSGGLLGEACARLFAEHTEVRALTRNDVDLTDIESLKRLLEGEVFDVLINAAAMAGLEQCMEAPEDAYKVNVEAPAMMADVARRKEASFVHFSTDYVFDGESEERPDENSKPCPINVYGKTKLEGEHAVLNANADALVCRVSWLFGSGRGSFVDQVIKTIQDGKEVTYISDKVSLPNYCDDLVQVLMKLLEKKASGVLHLSCDSEPESWYSYALEVVKTAKSLGLINEKNIKIHPLALSDATFFKEKRPKHTAMLTRRLLEEFGIKVPCWKDGLTRYLQICKENQLT